MIGSNQNYTFNYSGQTYKVIVPPGTTEEQARIVFEQQLKTGSIVGLEKGQTLDAASQLSKGLLSAASQIGSSIKSGISSAVSAATNLASKVSSLTGTPVGSPMNVADFVKVGAGVAKKIGSLSTSQVQGLMAQSAATANQASSAFSLDQGIGKFGINPTQLESAGFIKPGTLAQFGKNATTTAEDVAEAQRINAAGGSVTAQQIANNRQIKSLLSTSTVWTGKDGIGNLNTLLSDVNKQSAVQVNLLDKGYQSLNKAGLIPSQVSAAQVGSLVQTAGKLGAAAAAAWAKGAAPGEIVNQLTALAKQGQFAVNFTDNKIPEGAAGEQVARSAVNTVNRNVLNQSVTAFVGSPKVPAIDYGQPEAETKTNAPVVDTSALNTVIAKFNTELANLQDSYRSLQLEFENKYQGINADSMLTQQEKYRQILALRESLAPKLQSIIGSLADLFSLRIRTSNTYGGDPAWRAFEEEFRVREQAFLTQLTASKRNNLGVIADIRSNRLEE